MQKVEINPAEKYSLVDIVRLKLIKGVTTHNDIYNLVTKRIRIPAPKGEHKYKHVLARVTNRDHIKPFESNAEKDLKISSKLYVEGIEIINYLKLNHLY